MTVIKLLNTIHVLAVFLQVSSLIFTNNAWKFLWQVPPISNFCDHIESLWHDPHSIVWHVGKKHCDCFDTHSEWNPSIGLQTGENSAHYVQRIISSAELGLVLIGSLRVSSTHLKHVNAML